MASPKVQNLTVYRGDDKYYVLTFKDSAGVAIDISTWLVFFTAKQDVDDDDDHSLIKKNIGPGQPYSHTDPIHGKTQIHLTHSDTNLEGNKYYDIQIKKPTSDDIFTVITGIITFKADITRRTS
jgi:hypothetical protein